MTDPNGTCEHCQAPTWDDIHADGVGCYEAWKVGPIACGSDAGYKRHRRRGEEACQPCREAHSAYARLRRSELSPLHGTKRGLRLHLRYGTPVDEFCLYLQCALEAESRRRYYARPIKDVAA